MGYPQQKSAIQPASEDKNSSEPPGNTTSTGPLPLTRARKKCIVALQETKNPGDRVGYNQGLHHILRTS